MTGFKKMKNNNIALSLTNVTKKYFIHHQKPTLSEQIINGKKKEFIALRKINLNIKKGERVGIIGTNGSGKTTLLKIISGITSPTSGTAKIQGKIVSLIDLEAGFHEDLSGIENIYLNGMLLGMNRLEIFEKLNQIIKYADIGDFISAPLFTYSSGMKLRLGFAIAIQTEPDILILDEGFSVGDEGFKKKIQDTIDKIYKSGKTIITASHWSEYLRKKCSRVIWIEKGSIVMDGQPSRVLSKYHSEI